MSERKDKRRNYCNLVWDEVFDRSLNIMIKMIEFKAN